MLNTVISGGQTGADIAGVKAAKQFGLATGGMLPRGFLTLDGLHPEYAQLYSMTEHYSDKYPPRTKANVRDSDGTIRFAAKWESYGEQCTKNAISQHSKPYFDVDVVRADAPAPQAVVDWILANQIEILNVAGNSEKSVPGIEEFVTGYLLEVFRLLKELYD